MDKFFVVTNGDLRLGCKQDEVRHKLTHLCNYDAATLDEIFSGFPFTFKAGLDNATAGRYKAALDVTGIDCRIEKVETEVKIDIHAHGIDAVSHHPRSKEELMMSCPKCGEQQPKRLTCSACGVVVEKFSRLQQSEPRINPSQQTTVIDPSPNKTLRILLWLSVLTLLGFGCYYGYTLLLTP